MEKTKQPLNVAVVGIGNIGKHHVRNLADLHYVNLAAVVDTDNLLGEKISRQYHCRYYSTINALLNHEKIDAIVIAAPTRLHYSLAVQPLEQKIPTFIEKPISTTVQEAEMLIHVAKKNNTLLFIGHVERFNQAVVNVKHLLMKHEIGEIVSLVARRVGLFPPRSPDTNVVIDLAVHDIDIFSYLLAEQPQQIYASGGHIVLKNIEDHAELFLQYPSGTTGYIQVSWITPVKIRNLSITGTRGYIELDYINQTIQIIHNYLTDSSFDNFGQFVLKSQPKKKSIISKSHKEPLKLELASFINSIITNKPAAIPGEVGLAALQVAEKAVEYLRKVKSL